MRTSTGSTLTGVGEKEREIKLNQISPLVTFSFLCRTPTVNVNGDMCLNGTVAAVEVARLADVPVEQVSR